MIETLLELVHIEKLKGSQDLWTEATLSYLQDKVVEKRITNTLFEELMLVSVNDEKEASLFFKKAFSYCIFQKFSEVSKDIISKLKAVFQQYPLPSLEIMLRFLTMDSSPFSLPLNSSGAYINRSLRTMKFPSLLDLASSVEVAFFSFLYAEKKKDDVLFKQAEQLLEWIDHFFDEKNVPICSLWTESHEMEIFLYLHSFYLLYQLVESRYRKSNAHKKSEDLLAQMSELKAIPSLFSLIVSAWLTQLPASLFSCADMASSKTLLDNEAGVAVFSEGDFTTAVSYSGVQSSIAEVHCQDIQVVAIGPQHFPLKELTSFGNFRPFFTKESFSDVTFQLPKTDFLKTQGWIRLTQGPLQKSYGSKLWLRMESELKQDQVSFSFSFDSCLKEPSFIISLFIKAKSCLVEQTTLLPSTLDRFLGSPPKKLSFRGKEASLEVIFNECSKVHIIPLSGQKNFWEASFLLGCEPSFDHRSVHIELRKINS